MNAELLSTPRLRFSISVRSDLDLCDTVDKPESDNDEAAASSVAMRLEVSDNDVETAESLDTRTARPLRFWERISPSFRDFSSKRWAPWDLRPASRSNRERAALHRKAEWARALDRWTKQRFSKKVQRLCWQGIPPSVRGAAWKAIIGNPLNLTSQLFTILLARARATGVLAPQPHDDVHDESPNVLTPHESAIDRQALELRQLIEQDLPRTFPQLQFFHGDGPLRRPLAHVLATFVTYRPDMGYTQGMSYIAAMLLLALDSQVDAFIGLANLLNGDLHFALFRELSSARPQLAAFDRLMIRTIPRLAKHFCSLEIAAEMYLYDWLLTIYSHSFPLDISSRIWDTFLYYGPNSTIFLFRTAFGVLQLYEAALLQSNFEQCLHLLNHIPANMDENELFERIDGIHLTEKQFREALLHN